MPTDAYLATIARGVGVPEMWLEDCEQEMRLAEWQSGRTFRSTAIDFVRHFGPRTRDGHDRETKVIYTQARQSSDFTQTIDRSLDLAAAWPKMGPISRARIAHYALTGKDDPGHGSQRNKAQIRLRELVD